MCSGQVLGPSSCFLSPGVGPSSHQSFPNCCQSSSQAGLTQALTYLPPSSFSPLACFTPGQVVSTPVTGEEAGLERVV